MAQIFKTDFITGDLSDFTNRFPDSSAALTVIDDGGTDALYGDRFWNGGTTTVYSYDPFGSALDSEMLCIRRTPGTANNNRAAICLRIQPDGSHYQIAAASVSNIQITRVDVTSPSTVDRTFLLTGQQLALTDNEIYHWVRVSIVGGLIRVRSWDFAAAEPATWGLEVTDASPLPAGLFGVGGRTTSESYWTALSIGNAGDPAPTAPLPTGPNTPKNPAVTSLQANSARLTWDQG